METEHKKYYQSQTCQHRKMKKAIKIDHGDPDQMTHYVASELGLYCLSMSYTKDARLIYIKC